MLEKELAVAREAARAAGKVLSRMFGNAHHIVKKGEIDLVTEADAVKGEAPPHDDWLER